MRTAIHPHTRINCDAATYIADFGRNTRNVINRPLCATCGQGLSVVAISTPNSTGHFRHLPSSGYCPTKEWAAAAYAALSPQHPNAFNAQILTAEFKNSWPWQFTKLDFLVKGLTATEFKAVIMLANRYRVWEYSGLRIGHMPYVLSTLCDWKPNLNNTSSAPRRLWFRCWFDGRIASFDDLWIQRDEPALFFRGWYSLTKGSSPRYQDLVDSYSQPLSFDFLNHSPKVPPQFEKELVAWYWLNAIS